MAQCYGSMTHWCVSGISIYGSMLCIRHQHGSMLCIRHQIYKLNAVHQASMWMHIMHGSMLVHPQLKDVYQASVWLNAVHQASLWHNNAQWGAGINNIYGLMLCIRHHNTAQLTCASWFNMTRCGASMTQAVHHPSLWLNAAWLITLNVPHHILSTSFFATLFALTLEGKRKEEQNPVLAGCRFATLVDDVGHLVG